jgi:hypothetical protein
MTDCTELHSALAARGRDSEGHEGLPEGGSA